MASIGADGPNIEGATRCQVSQLRRLPPRPRSRSDIRNSQAEARQNRRCHLLPALGSELLLLFTTAQLFLRRRKAGISRTFSSIELRTGEERPYGSRPSGAAWRAYSEIGFAGCPSAWRAVGRSGGLSVCGSGAPRSI